MAIVFMDLFSEANSGLDLYKNGFRSKVLETVKTSKARSDRENLVDRGKDTLQDGLTSQADVERVSRFWLSAENFNKASLRDRSMFLASAYCLNRGNIYSE
jgi:hypothetical protein